MDLPIYNRLNTRSQRAMRRVRKKWGHPYQYNPRPVLMQRLCAELNMTEAEVREQIAKEREVLTRYRQYLR
ncbi:MAG: hypothetical protein QNJ65_05515 [Xenococcaceae cyanobacterium MO_234.B1]|nr:hypothetical protein [Xenococcaceae cyanobacterium MO_234.B1]